MQIVSLREGGMVARFSKEDAKSRKSEETGIFVKGGWELTKEPEGGRNPSAR